MHFRSFILACCVALLLFFPLPAFADSTSTPEGEVTAYDLVNGVNNIRVGNGLPALIVDNTIMSVAQVTAETMAANNMSGHIGGVRDRIAAAGYGVGDTVWATENFAMGPMPLNAILYNAWGDDLHMKPMADRNYCHVGAGVATAGDGTVYYIVQAAYTDFGICNQNNSSTALAGTATTSSIISQYIYPVLTATPQPDGSLLHIVQYGQTAWSIAEAYSVKLEDLINYNYYLTDEDSEVYVGQHIYIPVDKMQTQTPPGNGQDGSIAGTPGNDQVKTTGAKQITDLELTATYEVGKMVSTSLSALTASAAVPSSPTPTETSDKTSDSVRSTRRLIILVVVGGVFLLLFGYYTKYR